MIHIKVRIASIYSNLTYISFAAFMLSSDKLVHCTLMKNIHDITTCLVSGELIWYLQILNWLNFLILFQIKCDMFSIDEHCEYNKFTITIISNPCDCLAQDFDLWLILRVRKLDLKCHDRGYQNGRISTKNLRRIKNGKGRGRKIIWIFSRVTATEFDKAKELSHTSLAP